MNKMMIAIAMAVALPGAAFAQATPAPAQNAMGNMQGMNMSGMNMNGMNMRNMSCKDMHAMMAKGQSMNMSKADMEKMCPDAKAGAKAAPADAHQGHKH